MDAAPPEPRFLDSPAGDRIAYRHREGRGPTIVFLPGYMSDMTGGKAVAIDAWAERHGRAMLRLDYSGCGESGGDFEAGTLDRWRDEVLAVVDAVTSGPLLLIGSSMGGWLMLLVALARPDRVVALIGLAPAPDFTEWGYTDAKKRQLAEEGRVSIPSVYGGPPYVTTAGFWRSGTAHQVLGREIGLRCPVRLIHGQRDNDVPYDISIQLAADLRSDDVDILLIKDGDHRLSRPQDIAKLIATTERLLERL